LGKKAKLKVRNEDKNDEQVTKRDSILLDLPEYALSVAFFFLFCTFL